MMKNTMMWNSKQNTLHASAKYHTFNHYSIYIVKDDLMTRELTHEYHEESGEIYVTA